MAKQTGYTSKVYIQNQEAFEALDTLDVSLIGTKSYLGRAYFWAYSFRHHLRDASPKIRVKVHNEFLEAGLKPDGYTIKHFKIIEKIFKQNLSNYYCEASDYKKSVA